MWQDGGMWDDGGMGWWWIVPMIVFWGSAVALVVWGVGRVTGGKDRRPETDDTSLEIARKRFARGEITREEFEELREAVERRTEDAAPRR